MKKFFLLITLLMGILLTGCVSDKPHTPGGDNGGNGDDPIDDPIDEPEPDPSHLFTETDNYVVYINLDGFAWYYYDLAVQKGKAKTLQSLKSEGVLFNNLNNLFPSITNPMQAMIISGASSNQTHNVYRYYDKTTNKVIQQARENAAQTIYDVVVEKKIPVVSVRHFPSESVLSTTDINKLYVSEPSGVVADAVARFDQAIKVVRGVPFTSGNTTLTVSEVPRLLTIYCDDLDATGHNEAAYNYNVATSENGRLENVLNALDVIDGKIQELIDAYKERGIYEKTTFFITTDHGMTPFGAETLLGGLTSKYSRSKWPDLRDKLKAIDSSFEFEYVAAGKSPASKTTVVGVSAGLQMQLTFKKSLTEKELQAIKEELLKENYIGYVFTRNELIRQGYWRGANVDLMVVPSERYHFHGQSNPSGMYAVRGQHDSYQESSRRIFGIIWGYRVEKRGDYDGETTVTSFGVAMAEALGFNLKHANAPRLDIFTPKPE